MATDKARTIETMRQMYLTTYRDIHGEKQEIAFWKKIREMASSADASAWREYADGALANLGGESESYLAHCENAIALDPEFAYPWNGKGNALGDLKRYDEALAAYDKAIALDPKFAYPWNGKGNALRELKRYDEALAAFDKAIALDPEFAYPWNGKGTVLAKLKRYDEALAAFDKAIALGPEFPAPFYNRGLLYWRQGKIRESLTDFRQAASLLVDEEWKLRAEYWVERAQQMLHRQESGMEEEEQKREDHSSPVALITDLDRELADDLKNIRKKKRDFEERIAEAIGRPRVIGKDGDNGSLFTLRDWNSFSPILRRDLRGHTDSGPAERLGGGYFLTWRGHGIAIDPGVDFVTQLYRKGLSIADIDTVIVTHCHLDHTRDVESLVDLNYRYNQHQDHSPHSDAGEFRQIQFFLADSALEKYNGYLKASGCCESPTQLRRKDEPKPVSDHITVGTTDAYHTDINGKDSDAIGLVFDLKVDDGEDLRVGITSDTRWEKSLSDSFQNCDILLAHMGTIETGEEKTSGADDADQDAGGFLKTYLKNHLGSKGCFELMQATKPKLFILGEFGEELVETRIKILQVFNRLKPDETQLVLGADSNLAVQLIPDLSVRCSHPQCAKARRTISLDEVRPTLGDDFLFQYFCSDHNLAST